jgi:hypothetical protein
MISFYLRFILFANLPMKKIAFVFILSTCTSLFAAAKHELTSLTPGDPKKEQDKQPTFTLAKGYFSWFTLFSNPVTQADTFKLVTPVIPRNSEIKK